MSEESQIQKQYNSFKESGDKVQFTRIWEEHQRLLKEAGEFNPDKN